MVHRNERIRIPVKLLTLSFQPVLERGFRDYYNRQNQRVVRVAIVLAIVVVGAFGFLDRALAPDLFRRLWMIRYLYTMPFLVAPLLLLLIPRLERFSQAILLVASVGTGAGIIMIISVSGPPLSSLYYAGLMLTFMFLYGFVRLRFPLSVLAGTILFALYQASTLWFAPLPAFTYLNNTSFLVAAMAVGTAICYLHEYSVRRTFFLDRLLESEQAKLESMYETLEQTVNDRTGELKAANEELERLALFDALTGLHNRRSLNIRLQELIVSAGRETTQHSMALLYIDLDFFKDANDSYGHDVGDEILRQVAGRLRENIRASDYPCRLGGDEMIVFLSHIANDADAGYVAEKLLRSLAEPYHVRDYEIVISASIGVSLFPGDGASSPELLRCADAALRVAKRRRGTFVFYSESLHRSASARIQMIGQLRSARDNKQFFLLYHPIVDPSGIPVAAEALMRWNSPDRGIVPPLEFIPVLEDTGLIASVGTWIISQACRDAKVWLDSGNPVKVAVNVSPVQFRDPGFEQIVADALSQTGFPGNLLELEITEGLLLESVAETILKLRAIQKLGVTFAVDDFGTGYSSLSYLKELPVSALKIDSAFVRGLPDSSADKAIVRAVASMASGLGLKTVAEGVETPEQLAFLTSAGCDTFQGYLYSKPISPEETLRFVRDAVDAPRA